MTLQFFVTASLGNPKESKGARVKVGCLSSMGCSICNVISSYQILPLTAGLSEKGRSCRGEEIHTIEGGEKSVTPGRVLGAS